MVQEVQTPMIIPPLTTLEVIEWVGTSSEKIREWRQTIGRTISYCMADVSTDRYYITAWETITGIEWLFSNLVNTGKTDYAIGTKYLRFPMEWSYEITVIPFTWYSTFHVTTMVYIDWVQIYSYLSNDGNDREDKIKLDVWKYSRLTVQFKAYRNSWDGLGFYLYAKIWATQL